MKNDDNQNNQVNNATKELNNNLVNNTTNRRQNPNNNQENNVKKPRRYNPLNNYNMQDETNPNVNQNLPEKNNGLQKEQNEEQPDENQSSNTDNVNDIENINDNGTDDSVGNENLANNANANMANNDANEPSNQKNTQQNNANRQNKKSSRNDPTSNAINNKLNKLRRDNSNKNADNKPNNTGNETKKANNTQSKVGNAINAAKAVNEVANQAEEQGQSMAETAAQVAKEQAKQKAKQAVKTKIKEALIKYLVPILPYIALGLLLIFILLIILFAITSIFGDEEIVITNLRVNYCEKVIVKWEEDNVNKEETINYKEYIEYLISSGDYSDIQNEEVYKSLAIIYRTNFIANADNMVDNTCEFDLDEPYYANENEDIHNAVVDTKNKVFTKNYPDLEELVVDDNFTYYGTNTNSSGVNYKLYQDGMSYEKSWIDSHVDETKIVESVVEPYSFSPYAAWYLNDNKGYNYHKLLYHFYDPINDDGDIYNAVKIGGSEDIDGSNYCSDISLSSSSLSKEEFIEKVTTYAYTDSFAQILASNAAKIYDISEANSFNPELVVERALIERSRNPNNLWGIGYYNESNGSSVSYSSFEQGVLGYIKVIQGYNVSTLFDIYNVKHYAYIGRSWIKGGAGSGGCYYYDSIKKYLSEERSNEVEKACNSGNAIPTNDEDQAAYSHYQVDRHLYYASAVFGLSADSCKEESTTIEIPGDPSSLGVQVSNYAVATFDSWQYSQANRNQQGYVDCSSMVSRAYAHFGVIIYDGANSSGEIYRWCVNHGKVINGGQLQPGDLIFYNENGYRNTKNYANIGHVNMYIGNNQIFGAHTHYKDSSRDVRVDPYPGNGNLFCRPSK